MLEKKLKFEVYHVGSEHKNRPMSEIIQCHTDENQSTFEYKRAFYEFPKDGMDLSQYREIIEVPRIKVCDSHGGSRMKLLFLIGFP